jgi:hypothetical protein
MRIGISSGVPGKSPCRQGELMLGMRPLAKLMSVELTASEVIVADVSVQLVGILSSYTSVSQS